MSLVWCEWGWVSWVVVRPTFYATLQSPGPRRIQFQLKEARFLLQILMDGFFFVLGKFGKGWSWVNWIHSAERTWISRSHIQARAQSWMAFFSFVPNGCVMEASATNWSLKNHDKTNWLLLLGILTIASFRLLSQECSVFFYFVGITSPHSSKRCTCFGTCYVCICVWCVYLCGQPRDGAPPSQSEWEGCAKT